VSDQSNKTDNEQYVVKITVKPTEEAAKKYGCIANKGFREKDLIIVKITIPSLELYNPVYDLLSEITNHSAHCPNHIAGCWNENRVNIAIGCPDPKNPPVAMVNPASFARLYPFAAPPDGEMVCLIRIDPVDINCLNQLKQFDNNLKKHCRFILTNFDEQDSLLVALGCKINLA
jgi:hypothetical protein